jgi:hypothetical protein
MTAGLEANTAERFLVSTLEGDATLMALLTGGVHNTQAPQGTAYPQLVFQYMSGNDYAAVGAERIWTNMLYLVKVIADAEHFDDADIAAARVDGLLHRASGSNVNGTVWSCTREQVIRLPDQIGQHQYRQSGGIYRLYAA